MPGSTSTRLTTAAETGWRQAEQSDQQYLTRRSTGTLGFSLPVCCSFCLSLRYLFTCIMFGTADWPKALPVHMGMAKEACLHTSCQSQPLGRHTFAVKLRVAAGDKAVRHSPA